MLIVMSLMQGWQMLIYIVIRRSDNPDVVKQVRALTDNQASTEALVTNTSTDTNASTQGNRVREATRPCIFCNGKHFNDCCKELC